MRDMESYRQFRETIQCFYAFIHHNRRIVFYGAGVWGQYFYQLCEREDIAIDAFVVSDKVEKGKMFNDHIPIYSISELPFSSWECGIVLTLDEMYHRDIMNGLRINGYEHVFPVNEPLFQYAKVKSELYGLLNSVAIDAKQERRYEAEARKLKEKYRYFEFSFFEMGRIGCTIELYMQAGDSRFLPENMLTIFAPTYFEKTVFDVSRVCNPYLLKKIKENFCVITEENIAFWKYFMEHNGEVTFFYDRYAYAKMMDHQVEDILSGRFHGDKKHIIFTDEEKHLGMRKQREMELRGEYVCFFARTSRYVQTIFGEKSVADTEEARNNSVLCYLKVAEYLHSLHLQSVRMGYMAEGAFEGEGVIDYANRWREPFMDFYLIGGCKFLVTSFSGIVFIAIALYKPVLYVNAIVLTYKGDLNCRPHPLDLMLMKKKWDARRKRFLTLKEILDVEEEIQNIYAIARYYKDRGIEDVENTPDEIADGVKEMLARTDGTIHYSEEEINLQKEYRKILMESVKRSGNFYCDIPIGAQFLKKNKWILQ